MTKHSAEPAATLIRYLGGAQRVGTIIGKHPSCVYRWSYSEGTREGKGGLVPAKDQRRLLDYANSEGIDLRPEDFHSPDRLRNLMSFHSEVA